VNINLTLIGQMVAFVCFVMFCMKYVWPPIIAAMQERADKIADGLQRRTAPVMTLSWLRRKPLSGSKKPSKKRRALSTLPTNAQASLLKWLKMRLL
jgi:F-type H+-transporting ATPase subunit b